MSDLINRLRAQVSPPELRDNNEWLMNEAVDAIAALRAENERLREDFLQSCSQAQSALAERDAARQALAEAVEARAIVEAENEAMHKSLDAYDDRLEVLETALRQLRVDASDAGLDDTVEFITDALSRLQESAAPSEGFTLRIERRPDDDGLRVSVPDCPKEAPCIIISHADREAVTEDLASILRETIHAHLPPRAAPSPDTETGQP